MSADFQIIIYQTTVLYARKNAETQQIPLKMIEVPNNE